MNSTPTIRALVLSASVLALTGGSTFAQRHHRNAGVTKRDNND